MKLKHLIKNFLRNKWFNSILILQVVLGLIALNITLDLRQKITEETRKIISYFDNKDVYTLRYIDYEDGTGISDEFNSKLTEENFDECYNMLGNSDFLTFTHNDGSFPLALKQSEIDNFQNFQYYDVYGNVDGIPYFQAKNIIVNNTALTQFNVSLSQGRLFNFDEYSYDFTKYNNYIPLIVGSDYSNQFNLGDKISVYQDDGFKDGIIIGILEDNQFMPSSMSQTGDYKYVNLDNCIITTYSIFTSYLTKYRWIQDFNFILLDKDIPMDKINNYFDTIKTTFKEKLGMSIAFENQNNYVQSELDTYNTQNDIMTLTSLTIFIFITLTIIISLLNSIIKRKAEFSIHILTGGTLLDVSKMIYLETLTSLLLSLGISLNIIYFRYGNLTLQRFISLFFIIIIISILATIIPITQILKLDINSLMKGSD